MIAIFLAIQCFSPFFSFFSNMDSWTDVIYSKKALREVKQSNLYDTYAKRPFPEGPYVNTEGVPSCTDSEWPSIEVKSDSPLLAERLGTTDPVKISQDFVWLGKKAITFIANFPVPIYNISFEYEHDMTYDRKGRRAPVSYITNMYIWTYYKSHPIVHIYCMESCHYNYSISPFFTGDRKECLECEMEWWTMDTVMRMMELVQ